MNVFHLIRKLVCLMLAGFLMPAYGEEILQEVDYVTEAFVHRAPIVVQGKLDQRKKKISLPQFTEDNKVVVVKFLTSNFIVDKVIYSGRPLEGVHVGLKNVKAGQAKELEIAIVWRDLQGFADKAKGQNYFILEYCVITRSFYWDPFLTVDNIEDLNALIAKREQNRANSRPRQHSR